MTGIYKKIELFKKQIHLFTEIFDIFLFEYLLTEIVQDVRLPKKYIKTEDI